MKKNLEFKERIKSLDREALKYEVKIKLIEIEAESWKRNFIGMTLAAIALFIYFVHSLATTL